MRLAGKAALITGAGAGIGRASCLAFAREGARLLAVDLNAETGEETVRLVRAEGGDAYFHRADVSVAAAVERMMTTAVEKFGQLDVLFNNAGVVPGGTVLETDEETWDRTIAINLRSAFLGCRYAVPQMQRQGGGVIVNTASVAGIVGVKQRAAYSASKMGVIGLTRSVALDFIQDGIRCNAICPGTVDTPSLRDRMAATGDADRARAEFIARQPMGRLGTAEEIAALAVYLASDESAYMTGREIIIDGGLSL